MGWIEDWVNAGSYPSTEWVAGFKNVADFNAKIAQRFYDIAQRLSVGTWTKPTLGSNWNNVTGTGALQYQSRGLDQVWVQGAATRANTTLAADGTWSSPLFTFPTGLRPTSIWHIYADASTNSGVDLQCRINIDGTVQIRNVGTTALPVGDNLNINGVFLLS